MALVQIRVSFRREYDILCGQSVYLCLQSFWANRTVDGTNRVLATVRSGPVKSSTSPGCPPPSLSCCGTANTNTWYTYCVDYDDSQILEDITTNQPYIINPCVDVLSLLTDICLVDSLSSGPTGQFEFTLAGDTGVPQTINEGNTVAIVGGTAIETAAAATDTVIINTNISTDAGQAITLGTDGGLYVLGSGGGPVDCNAIRACINVGGFIQGDGTIGTPYSSFPSADADNIVTYGGDNGVYAPTDVLEVSPSSPTPIGGTLLRHIAADGTITSFPTGFNSVQSSALCGTPGVSANKAVRSITLSGQLLVLDAAPEHTTIATSTPFNGSPGTNISPVGSYFSGASGLVFINNPSTCRILRGVLNIYWASNVAVQTSGVWRYTGRLSVNGAPITNVAQTQWGIYPGLTGTVWLMVAALVFDIPAAGSISFQWDQVIETLVPSAAGSLWSQFNSGITFSGSTV